MNIIPTEGVTVECIEGVKLRGIDAMNPLTPPGLPYGDKAALARVDGNSGGLVFFIDGDKACTPMPVPDKLLAMMDDVATAKINHEGSGL